MKLNQCLTISSPPRLIHKEYQWALCRCCRWADRDVNVQLEFYMTTITQQWSLILETLSSCNAESIEFSLCVSLLCLFVWLSIFSIWLLCKPYNQYNTPTNIYQPSAWPEGGDTTTIHEWEVTQLLPLIQGYLFQLPEMIMYQLLISHKWTCEEHWPILLCGKPRRHLQPILFIFIYFIGVPPAHSLELMLRGWWRKLILDHWLFNAGI